MSHKQETFHGHRNHHRLRQAHEARVGLIAGDFSDIDRKVERYRAMQKTGLTDLALRVFEEPFEALRVICERVIPQFR